MSDSEKAVVPLTPTYEIVEETQETTESIMQRTARMLAGEDFMEYIFDAMCMGASLATIADTRNLKYYDVCRYVKTPARKQKFQDALQMRRDFVIDKLVDEDLKIAVADLRTIFNKDGTLMPPHEWPDSIAGAIESIEVKEIWGGKGDDRKKIGESKKVKLCNKLKAIQMLGQEHGIFKDKMEHSADESLEALIMQSYEKKEKKDND